MHRNYDITILNFKTISDRNIAITINVIISCSCTCDHCILYIEHHFLLIKKDSNARLGCNIESKNTLQFHQLAVLIFCLLAWSLHPFLFAREM